MIMMMMMMLMMGKLYSVLIRDVAEVFDQQM